MASARVLGDKGFSFFEVRAFLWTIKRLGVTGLVSCFNHEMKSGSLPVRVAVPFACGNSQQYHFIFVQTKIHSSLQMLLSHLHFPLGTYKIKYTPKLLHHLELIQTPLTKLHLRCPYFHPLEKWVILPAPFFPWPDKTHLLLFLQSSFAQYCQSKGLLFAMLS